jgi:hypothetical protein
MSTVATRISNATLPLVAHALADIGQQTTQARGLWQVFGWKFDPPGPQTESSIERDDEWGRSESLDPDNVGDIADEGAGHRG